MNHTIRDILLTGVDEVHSIVVQTKPFPFPPGVVVGGAHVEYWVNKYIGGPPGWRGRAWGLEGWPFSPCPAVDSRTRDQPGGSKACHGFGADHVECTIDNYQKDGTIFNNLLSIWPLYDADEEEGLRKATFYVVILMNIGELGSDN